MQKQDILKDFIFFMVLYSSQKTLTDSSVLGYQNQPQKKS